MKVLIVDDEEGIVDLLATVLLNRGYDIDMCHSPLEAFEKLLFFKYDRVLTDVNMPVMTGYQLYDVFKYMRPTSETQWVFMSGNPDNLAKMPLGSKYITKPFHNDTLDDVLK